VVFFKSGHYVKRVKLHTEISSAVNATFKVMGYEPETYLTAGAVTLKTTLKCVNIKCLYFKLSNLRRKKTQVVIYY
jgi:hypothetical protein